LAVRSGQGRCLSTIGVRDWHPAAAIFTIDEVVGHLGERLAAADRARIAAYCDRFGPPSRGTLGAA
jgi:hypothetical protein